MLLLVQLALLLVIFLHNPLLDPIQDNMSILLCHLGLFDSFHVHDSLVVVECDQVDKHLLN